MSTKLLLSTALAIVSLGVSAGVSQAFPLGASVNGGSSATTAPGSSSSSANGAATGPGASAGAVAGGGVSDTYSGAAGAGNSGAGGVTGKASSRSTYSQTPIIGPFSPNSPPVNAGGGSSADVSGGTRANATASQKTTRMGNTTSATYRGGRP